MYFVFSIYTSQDLIVFTLNIFFTLKIFELKLFSVVKKHQF